MLNYRSATMAEPTLKWQVAVPLWQISTKSARHPKHYREEHYRLTDVSRSMVNEPKIDTRYYFNGQQTIIDN